MKKLHLLAPISFAILPTLLLYSHNVREAWPVLIVRPLIVSLVFGIFSWLAAVVVFRNKFKASIFSSVWLILFFAYGHAYLTADQLGIFKVSPIGPHLLLMGVYGVFLLSAFGWLWRLGKSVAQLSQFFTVAGIVLILVNAAQLIPFEINRLQNLARLKSYMSSQQISDATITNTDSSTYPDIYYFVFDRYASNPTYQEYFNYDNTEFLNSLQAENFFLADKSLANYPTTFLSLSSSLNATHLLFLKELLGENYADQSVVYQEFLDDSEVAEFLIARGYEYYQLGSSWEPTKKSSLASANFNQFLNINEFESFLFENTLLNAVLGKVSTSNQVFTGVKLLEIQQKNVSYKRDQIKQLATQERQHPQFVFGHFLLPHPPYLHGSDCQPLSFEEVRKRSDNTGYIDQVQCANKVMVELAETIKNQPTNRPVVIIFQSDEGPFLPEEYFKDTEYIDTENNDAYKIHARILNAYYLTNKESPNQTANYEQLGLTRNTSPVNTFRLVFNYYFGTELPLQQNRSFIFKDQNQPYFFTEITDFAQYLETE